MMHMTPAGSVFFKAKKCRTLGSRWNFRCRSSAEKSVMWDWFPSPKMAWRCIPSPSSSLYIWNQGSSCLVDWQLGAWFQTYGRFQNRGTPKWMVYNGKTLLKWMIWGCTTIFGNIHIGNWKVKDILTNPWVLSTYIRPFRHNLDLGKWQKRVGHNYIQYLKLVKSDYTYKT